MLRSHPVEVLESQFAYPASQDAMVHAEATQPGVPCDVVQAIAQSPQCPTVFVMFVSQPSVSLVLQFPVPGVHVATLQTPVVHEVVAALGSVQPTPHAPQSVVVRRLFSQPSVATLLQSSKAGSHESTPHVVPVHFGVPLATVHFALHAPQLLTSSWTGVRQRPLLSQSPNPLEHVEYLQVLATHVGVPPLVGHAPAQVPQWSGSLVRSVSQPFPTALSQSSKPERQPAMVHVPLPQ
jgi:hypothetical protein